MRHFRFPTSAMLAALVAITLASPIDASAQQSAAAPAPADLILTNGRVYTVDIDRPVVRAMAVRDGKVAFVGSDSGVMALRGSSTRMIDLAGRTVIPGMVDAHAHFAGLGSALANVDLTGTKSYDEVIARVVAKARTLPAGEWVLGRGWDQNEWGNTAFPTHEALSRAIPDHPVLLTRIDGHANLANAAAMKLAGVDANTKDPDGGRIERDANGAPIGVFVDNAQGLVGRVVPPSSPQQRRDAILAAIDEMHRWGLTGIHDAGAGRSTIDLYEELAKAGKLQLRTYVMIGDSKATLDNYFARGPQSGLYGDMLWIRSIKLYADGALGSRGAALLDPYSDDPNNNGLLVSDPKHIEEVAERALLGGFQVATHAIGDRGNRVVLDAYEQALRAHPTVDHRFRVEHAQILNHDDIPRFAELDVIPSMQAVHQTSDMYWAGTRLGISRLLGAYAWRSLLDTGMPIPNGSDFPVERVNPLFSFHSAVSRQNDNNLPTGGWYPEQRMTREEALRSVTIWPAFAGFQEDILGSLTPGKLADFVILDQDIMRVATDVILNTRVLATYVGGKAVYEAR